MASQAPFGGDSTSTSPRSNLSRMPVSPPIDGVDSATSGREPSTRAPQRASTNPFVVSAQESSGPPRFRARAATGLTDSNTNVSPGTFDPYLPAHQQRLGSNDGLEVAISEQDPFTIVPTALQDALQSRASSGGRFIDVAGQRVSYASDVSSLSPSEAEMMTGAPIIFPRTGRSFERPHPGLAGMSMEDVFLTPEELSASGYHHTREFSNVESIFDVVPLNAAGSSHPVQSSDAFMSTATENSRIPSASENESPYGRQGSGTISTPTRPSRAQSTPYTSNVAPMLSLVAGAATGGDVISGNRTLEQSSFGSEDTAPRKRHYEGCMMCDPLPSPCSSLSSVVPIPFEVNRSSPGPPPDIPLPSLIPQTAVPCKGPLCKPTALNALGSYMELEGEVSAFISAPAGTGPSVVLGEPGPDYFSLQHPASLEAPYATGYHHRGSLSTLQEGDEDSNQQSGQPSSRGIRVQSSERPRAANTAGSKVIQSARPGTSGNDSQSSLIGISSAPAKPSASYLSSLRSVFVRQTANPLARWTNRLSGGRPDRDESDGIELQQRRPVITQQLYPHPGVRVDRPGVDGTYEIVDLSSPTPMTLTTAETADIPIQPLGMRDKMRLWKRQTKRWFSQVAVKMRGPMYRYRWSILAALFGAIVLLIVIPTVFIAFPAVAQKRLDKAVFNVTSFSITGAASDSLDLRMGVRMMDTMIDASFEPEQSFVLRYEDRSIEERDHIKGHSDLDGKFPNILGFLKLADREEFGNKLAEGVVLGGNEAGNRFRISDAEGLADVMSRVVFENEGIPAVLVGKCKMRAAGLNTEAEFAKEIALPVVGGFDTHVTGYDIVDHFSAHISITTNSTVEIDFGTVTFDLVYGLTTIGTATVDAFRLQEGTTTITATGYLSEEMSKQNPVNLGRFLTSLFIQTNSNPTTALSLQGRNATLNGTEISWLAGAVRKLNIRLPAVDAKAQGDIVTGLELGFGVVVNETMILAEDGYVSGRFNFSFASGGSAAVISSAGHRLELGTMSGDSFARIRVPVGPVSTQGGTSTTNFTETEIEVINVTSITNGLLRPIIHNQAVNVSILDNITAEVKSGLGTARFEDIGMPEAVWEIGGYGGFNSKVALKSPQMNQSPSGIQLDVKLELAGAGEVRLKFGEVKLRAFYDGLRDHPMGTLTIPSFSLSPGSLTFPATLTLGATKDEQVPFDGFMAAYFAGGAIPLHFDALNASTSAVVSNTLRGLNISATLNSTGYSGFLRSAELVIDQSEEDIQADVEFVNLLPIPMKIGTFLFDLKDAATGTKIGTGGSNSPLGAGRELDPNEVQTYRLKLSNVMNDKALKGLFKGDRLCDLEGQIAIGIGNVEAQIGVKVRRVVGLTVMV